MASTCIRPDHIMHVLSMAAAPATAMAARRGGRAKERAIDTWTLNRSLALDAWLEGT
jgi:hypothetical protein